MRTNDSRQALRKHRKGASERPPITTPLLPVLSSPRRTEGVTQSKNLALSLSRSSFPRKREPRDFSRLLLGPRFRGDDEFGRPQDLLTASQGRGPSHRARTFQGR